MNLITDGSAENRSSAGTAGRISVFVCIEARPRLSVRFSFSGDIFQISSRRHLIPGADLGGRAASDEAVREVVFMGCFCAQTEENRRQTNGRR